MRTPGHRRGTAGIALVALIGPLGCWKAARPAGDDASTDLAGDTGTPVSDTGTAIGDTGTAIGDTGTAAGDSEPLPETSGDTDRPDTDRSDRLLPIAVGNQWRYEVETFSNEPLCAAGQYLSEITETILVDGEETFEMVSFCNFEGWGQPSSRLRIGDDGQSVDRYYGEWFSLIDPPVEDGHTWPCEHGECRWESAGSVETPAGTFGDCWTRRPVIEDAGAYADTYCRGIGMVTSRVEDDYNATLVEYHLSGDL